MWLYRGLFPCFILASTGWATVAHRWQCHGTGAVSTLLLSCCHFFRGSSLVRPLRFRCGTVVVRLLIRAAAPLFYGCHIRNIFAFLWVSHLSQFRRFIAASSPLFMGVGFVGFSPVQTLFYRRSFRSIFGRSRGRLFSYLFRTYSSRIRATSVRVARKGAILGPSRVLCVAGGQDGSRDNKKPVAGLLWPCVPNFGTILGSMSAFLACSSPAHPLLIRC